MAPLVNYSIRNKQVAPRSKFIAMTRIYDLNLALRQKRQVKHVAAMIFLRTLKIFAAYVEKRCLIRNGSNPWFNLASALIFSVIVGGNFICDIFPECLRGPLKTLWRATCGPRAANCQTLL